MSKLHALTWLLFAGTAFIAALLFPALLFYLSIYPHLGYDQSRILNNLNSNLFFKLIFFVVLASVIYHGFYRAKAIFQELFPKSEGAIEMIMIGLALFLVVIALIITVIL